MKSFLKQRFRLIPSTIPQVYQNNFKHYYFDIAWFGVLNGSILAFLSIYCARIGASGQQIGIISAMPAIANIIFTLPAGSLMKKQIKPSTAFRSAILQRMFYLPFVFFPAFLLPAGQIWLIIILNFVLSIPGTILNMAFNKMFAETVPIEYRGSVAGIRNALLAATSILSLLISGQLLANLSFPLGYQIVFVIGFIGAIMSSFHLGKIQQIQVSLSTAENETIEQTSFGQERVKPRIRKKINLVNSFEPIRLNTFSGKTKKVLFLLFGFNLFLYLAIPIFPVYQVNILKLQDSLISLGSSLFYVTSFIGSLQYARFQRKYGNQLVLSAGMIGLALYPLLLPLASNTLAYLLISLTNGYFWALIAGSLVNYLLESMPEESLASGLTLYNLSLNAAILLGSLTGPLFSDQFGLLAALLVFGAGRLLSGFAVIKWGK